MLLNYLKVALRNLWKNRGFSFINITGLAIGMASAILILLWIQNEVSYDQFHEKKDRIYEVWNRAIFSGQLHCWNTTPKVLASAMQHDFPEVEHVARLNFGSHLLLTVGDKRLSSEGNMVDSDFLQVFTFPLLKGDLNTALVDMHSIVLTQTLAKKLFGAEEPMGKLIRVEDKENLKVTGIVADPPNNTRFQFEYLMSWAYYRHEHGDDLQWDNNSTRTYVLLKPNASVAGLAPKMKLIKGRYEPDEPKWEMFLYPISRWRLYSSFKEGVEQGGKIEFVRLFGIIAGFLVLIACINFMNLSTARSEKRAKEVGIRKVVGAPRSALIAQFIGESMLLALIAGALAIGIVQLSLHGFNELTAKRLFVPYGSPYFWIAGLLFVLVTGLLAGSYPAFFLSSFQPVKVLKGTFKKAHALITPRKVLVVLQFTFAITLIICTIIVKQQISHAQARDTGYDRNNLVYHYLTGDVEKNYVLIRQDLLSSGAASAVTKTSAPLTQAWSDTWGFTWDGTDPNDKTDFDRYCADEELAATAGIQLVAGRDFDLKQYPTDSTGVILNESAVRAMHFSKPLGQVIGDDNVKWHVVGVIKDFILRSPYSPTTPMVIEGAKGWFSVIHIKLNSAHSTEEDLAKAKAIFSKYNPVYPFEYHFIDEDYAKKFDDERRTGTLTALFAALTVFISCLGLFGLATYMAENRIKEIGVRKVLGASVTGLASLLTRDFLRLVLISLLIASLIAWIAMHIWLQGYAYRIAIEWWVFAAAGLMSVGIAVVTVSFQAIRAATANPVKSLRTE
ncbi:MAG: ABC transporter permease [Bacteroidota bacterium]|nr:ABC transporter permease [Bacteroidota bacterium]